MKRYLKKVIFCGEDQPDVEQGVLYIVDTKQKLDRIKNMGLPVLAWLHEGNKDQDLSGAAYAVENPDALDMDFYEKVYCREMNISWEILETERLLIREMIPEDAAAFEEIYKEAAIKRYMKDFHGDAAGEAAYIREYQAHYRFYEYGVWSIVLKDTGKVIGRAGFSNMPGYPMPEHPGNMQEHSGTLPEGQGEIGEMDGLPCLGYMIGVPWQRQGYAEEACRAILDYAREELDFTKVFLQVEEENEASIKLAKKLGFEGEGTGCLVMRKVL